MSNEATPPNAPKAIPAWIFKPTFSVPVDVMRAAADYRVGETMRNNTLAGLARSKKTGRIMPRLQADADKANLEFNSVKMKTSRVIRNWMNHVTSKHHDIVTNLCLEYFLKLAEDMGKDNDLLDAISKSLPPTADIIRDVDCGRAMDCTLPIGFVINGNWLYLRVDCEDGRVNGFTVAEEKHKLNSLFGSLASVSFAYESYRDMDSGKPRSMEIKVNGHRELDCADTRLLADVLVQLADLADVLVEFEKSQHPTAYGDLLDEGMNDAIGIRSCHEVEMPRDPEANV